MGFQEEPRFIHDLGLDVWDAAFPHSGCDPEGFDFFWIGAGTLAFAFPDLDRDRVLIPAVPCFRCVYCDIQYRFTGGIVSLCVPKGPDTAFFQLRNQGFNDHTKPFHVSHFVPIDQTRHAHFYLRGYVEPVSEENRQHEQ